MEPQTYSFKNDKKYAVDLLCIFPIKKLCNCDQLRNLELKHLWLYLQMPNRISVILPQYYLSLRQGRLQLWEIGEGKAEIRGAKLKTSVELDPNFLYFWFGFRQIFSKNQVISKNPKASPKSEGFFWPKSEIYTFFSAKNRWSPKKKKVLAKIRRLFLAET